MNKLILGVLSVCVTLACFDNKATPVNAETSSVSEQTRDTMNQENAPAYIFTDHTLMNDEYRFAFYNVENLFDTLDNKDKIDEEFMPQSEKAWNTERYKNKLSNLASVIEGMSFPSIVGLSEVENKAVVEDLVNTTALKNQGYEIVHYESPDMRGIDVALLYKKSDLKFKKSDRIRVEFPDHIEKGYTSRDILMVEGTFKGQEAYFFVNHWPSRYGGAKESEPKRKHVAQYLRTKIDAIQSKNPKASLFIMGDFNDEPEDKSLVEVLKAHTDRDKVVQSTDLFNCSAEQDRTGRGSQNYKGKWGMLDQVIVSGSTIDGTSKIHMKDFEIYAPKSILYHNKKYNNYKPNRSYAGPRYYGGFSDHLPVYIDVKVEE